jgi:adenylate kinase family enzyme
LDGFPESEAQINLLKSMKIKPSLIFFLEQSIEESVRRLSSRKIDPVTGNVHNEEIESNLSELVKSRLESRKQDDEVNTRKRYVYYNGIVSVLDDAFRGGRTQIEYMQKDTSKSVESTTDFITEKIMNPEGSGY